MKPEIASLHDRIAQGGDWRSFRDEIAALHEKPNTEEEYVSLLEAHSKLVAVAKFAYDHETYSKLLPIIATEYLMFLNKEAMQGESISPLLLERVTGREVEAGRLAPDDPLRKLAVAGASVLRDSAEITSHRCKRGDWFFYGVGASAILSTLLALISWSPLWLIALGLIVGWYVNERERTKIKIGALHESKARERK